MNTFEHYFYKQDRIISMMLMPQSFMVLMTISFYQATKSFRMQAIDKAVMNPAVLFMFRLLSGRSKW